MKNEHQLMDRENLKTSKVHFLNATSVINVYKGMFLSFQKTIKIQQECTTYIAFTPECVVYQL